MPWIDGAGALFLRLRQDLLRLLLGWIFLSSNRKPAVPRRSVTDPRDGRKVALKKMPNVFQNLVSCKRVFRELRMLCFFKHDNVRTG